MSGTINRRNFLAAAPAALLPARAQTATRGMPAPIIKDVTVIATAPAGLRLSVVKVTTDQDGLYGYGCATFTQRAELVNAAVEKYLRPFLIGQRADRIEDIWQACRHGARQGGVPGMAGYGAAGGEAATGALQEGPVFEPAYYVRRALKLFEECRKQLGDEVELLHDVHERVSPNQAVQFLKDTERFKMFFM